MASPAGAAERHHTEPWTRTGSSTATSDFAHPSGCPPSAACGRGAGSLCCAGAQWTGAGYSILAFVFAWNHTDVFVTASTPLKRRTSHYRPGFPLCRSTSSTSPKGTQAQFSQLSLLVERPCWSAARREVVEMRRIAIVLVLVLVAGVWPAASGVAHGATAAPAAPARSLQADFHNDGAADLAVGVPFENVGSIVAAGAVNVLYGSATGLTTIGSQFFTQDTPGIPNNAEQGDVFGFALAAGDFNADTFADLAVGAPGESVGSIVAAGAVNVLYGSPTGLTTIGSQFFTQVAGAVETDDEFGCELAAGDFNHDTFADLAAGAPFENVGSRADAGALSVLPGSAGGLTAVGGQLFTQVAGAIEADDSFGYELVAGDFNADTFADLAAGAPFEDVGSRVDAGAVSVLPGSAGGLTTVGGQLFTQVAGTVEAEDGFGWALAAGDFNADTFADLAAGAPFEDVGRTVDAGAVSVLPGSAGGLTTVGGQLFTQDTPGVPNNAEAFDGFGFTLATGDPGPAAAASASPSGSSSRTRTAAPSR